MPYYLVTAEHLVGYYNLNVEAESEAAAIAEAKRIDPHSFKRGSVEARISSSDVAETITTFTAKEPAR